MTSSRGRGGEDQAVGVGPRRLPPQPQLIAGLDIGGTKALAVLADSEGRILAQKRLATGHRGAEGLLATVTRAVLALADLGGVDARSIAAVGIGVPGLVDPGTGQLRHAVNLGVGDESVDLAGPVARLIDGPATVANDTNLAALGALPQFPGVSDLAYLSLGTGVAVGLVLGGEMHPGTRGMAGEIGHVPVDRHGEICECGQRGCLETVVSGAAIARRWPPSGDDGTGPTEALLAAAADGDARAIAVRDELCEHVATAVALVAQLVDPDLVVLGGGVAEAGAPLLEGVRVVLRRRAGVSPLLGALGLAERVAIVPAGVPVGALGAVRAASGALTS
jgi:glucokinase